MGQTYDIQPMTSKSANEIIKWTYETPYQLYNMTDDEETIQELLDGTYFQADDRAGELAGYFCFGKNAQVPGGRRAGVYKGHGVLDIGLGMHPDLTGKGLGLAFLMSGIVFAKHLYEPNMLRLSVAVFNQRAIKLYEKAGFQHVRGFENSRAGSVTAFMLMVRNC